MEKSITLDELARMIQDEFTAVRSEMREEFKGVYEVITDVRNDIGTIREDTKILRRDTEASLSSITEILKSMQEDIRYLKKMDIEFLNLRERVERLEAKLGIA